MTRWAVASALLVLVLPMSGAAAQGPLYEKARAARSAGRVDDAEKLLRQLLQTDPQNYLGLYNMGLVYEARALHAPPGAQRIAYYRTAAGWLEKAYASPRRASAGEDAYTIYNSLGAMYLGFADLNHAQLYLLQGLRYEAKLDDFSRGRLYGNVGYLYALQGDIKQARIYFQKGAKLGSAFSNENLSRLDKAGLR